VAQLPKGTSYLEPASLAHFDFLGLCTAQGLALLKEEEPDDAFVCDKGVDERAKDHVLIADAIEAFFVGL
jgi:hypothetical protein